MKSLFEERSVQIDGRTAKKGASLLAGQMVIVEYAQVEEAIVPNADMALSILFEDEQIVAIDKPAGTPCQPLGPSERDTIANALVARFEGMAKVGDDWREAGLCHRLDIETSGVLLAAKTRTAWEAMRQAFSGDARAIDKYYVALVAGPIADEGTIDLPLVHRGDHMSPDTGETGRPALTRFHVTRRHEGYALLDVQLITGVLHQVRAHLAAIGAPIVGDRLYGGPIEIDLNRFFLHARSLAFAHPVTGKRMQIESQLPDELTRILSAHF